MIECKYYCLLVIGLKVNFCSIISKINYKRVIIKESLLECVCSDMFSKIIIMMIFVVWIDVIF